MPDGRVRVLLAAPWICWLVVVMCDQLLETPRSLPVGGTIDVFGHLATGAAFALAAWALDVRIPWLWVLVGAVVVDFDHIPVWLGWIDRFDTTSRGVLHTAVAVWAVLAVAAILPRQRTCLVAVAVGIASHLFRDLGTGTVQIAWPVLDTVRAISYRSYVLALSGVCVLPFLAGARATFDTLRHAGMNREW